MNAQDQYLACEEFPVAAQVRAAQGGDREAFGALATHFQRTVFSIAMRRLGNRAEAQELSQEVFVQAMCKLHQLTEPACFPGWLRSITVRMAINRAMRRGPVTSGDATTVEERSVQDETPLRNVLRRERHEQVQVGLRRLKPCDRDTLVAFYFDGRSLVEMADRFRTPVGTIKRRLHVARKRLAKELETLAPA